MRHPLVFGLCLGFLASVASLSAAEPEQFSNPELGITIDKPAGWHFQPVEVNTRNLNAAVLDDEKLQELVRKNVQVPLVLMTRYPEPTDQFNPSIKLFLKPISDPDRFDPLEPLEFMLTGIKRAYRDLKVVEQPKIVQINGASAAYAKVHFTLKTTTGQMFPTCSELWLVPRGKLLIIVGAGSSQRADAAEHAEIAQAIGSLKF